MKVLYVAHSSGIQGSGLALLNIVKGVIANGIEPVVVLPYYGPLVDKLKEMGVTCHYVMCYNTVYPRTKYAIKLYRRRIKRST